MMQCNYNVTRLRQGSGTKTQEAATVEMVVDMQAVAVQFELVTVGYIM